MELVIGKVKSATSSPPPAGWAAPLCLYLLLLPSTAADPSWPPSPLRTAAYRINMSAHITSKLLDVGDRPHFVWPTDAIFKMWYCFIFLFIYSEILNCSRVSPDPGISSAESAPAAPLLHGWLLLPPRTSPGPSLPAAARCAAASLSEPPAGLWCLKSYERTELTFLSAVKMTQALMNHTADVKSCTTQINQISHQSCSAGFPTDWGGGGADGADGGSAGASFENGPPPWALCLGRGGTGEANSGHLVNWSKQAIPGHALEVPEEETGCTMQLSSVICTTDRAQSIVNLLCK